MPTQITNKQVKIIDTVNFNNQAIENAIIDGSKNTINNLDITKNLVDAGITKITSSDTMIELAQEIENKHFSIGTTLFGEIENTGMPFQGNAEVRVDILDEKDDDDQVILFTLYSTNVEPYEWEWRYYLSNTVVWIAKALPDNDYTSNSQNTVPTSYALKTGLDTKQDVLVSGTNIKTINGSEVLGSGNLAVTTYQSFPNSWPTNTTFTALIEAIKNDTTAVKGMAYLGKLTCSGLPSELTTVETVIEIMDGTTAQNKVIHTTLTSSDVEPYRWEYTYWSGNPQVNWIGFDYNREIKTLNTTTPTTNVYLDANNTYILNCSDQVTGLTIVLLEPDNENINNSILLHSYIGTTNIQILWGTDKFFSNETPTIDSIGYYDIIYVWNNLLNKYVCNVTFISEN